MGHATNDVNATAVRTVRGQQLVAKATAAGFLELAPLSGDEFDQMHYDHRPRKLGWPAVELAMKLMRQPMLSIRGYRRFTTVRQAGASLSWGQFTGTIRRVVRGNNSESKI